MNAKQASELIMKQVGETATADTAGGGAGQDFCSIWPRAKPILELLAGIAILIPGVGATAGGVLKGLVKVGDGIAAETCS